MMFLIRQSCRQKMMSMMTMTMTTARHNKPRRLVPQHLVSTIGSIFDEQQQQQQQQRWATSSSKKKSQAMKRQRKAQGTNEEENKGTATKSKSSEKTTTTTSSSFSVDTSSQTAATTSSANTTTTTAASSSSSFSSSFGDSNKKQQRHVQLPSFSTDVVSWETDKKDLMSSLTLSSSSSFSNNNINNPEAAIKESMFDPKIHLPHAPQQWTSGDYEPATPLSDALMQSMGVNGKPITIAEYMRNALTHPLYGYYTTQTLANNNNNNGNGNGGNDDDFDDNDWDMEDDEIDITTTSSSDKTSKIFGRRGDFITAPEVSHVFGHCICVWFMTQWESSLLNKPSQLQLVELGPGRGTLMTDILQLALTAHDKMDFGRSITTVNLIEASLELRDQQRAALEEGVGHLVNLEFWVGGGGNAPVDEEEEKIKEDDDDDNKKKQTIRVVWYDDFTSFQHRRDKDIPVMMVLQEFLDALPIHVFRMTKKGWREQLVDVVEAPEAGQKIPEEDKPLPRLRQVLAPDVTPAVDLFCSSSESYNQSVPVDTVVEVCPEAILLVQDMAKVMEESKGVALIIDYGEDGTSDTLRAFSKHKQVPLTSLPGQVDVTADVDFFALRKTIESAAATKAQQQQQQNGKDDDSLLIHAFGPVTQGEFLMRMGAGDMVIHAIEQDETSEEQAQKLYDALQFLVMPEHMGKRYKVLSMAPKRDGIFAPPGMEKS